MNKVELKKNKLLEILKLNGALKVDEVSLQLGVSLPTARRLCAGLSAENKAIRTHGGIKRLEVAEDSYSFDQLCNDHIEEKNEIAQYASTLVESNQVIFLEAGTTLRQFALALAQRIKNKEITNVIIFTNSLINLNILYPVQEKIMLIGGHYRDERKDFVGYLSERSLKGLQFHHCFVGCDAVSTDGVMAMDIETVCFDSELVKHAENLVVLAHSDKFNKKSLISYAALNEISAIITDAGLSDDILNDCEEAGTKIIRV